MMKALIYWFNGMRARRQARRWLKAWDARQAANSIVADWNMRRVPAKL